jgi:hypothetical protein
LEALDQLFTSAQRAESSDVGAEGCTHLHDAPTNLVVHAPIGFKEEPRQQGGARGAAEIEHCGASSVSNLHEARLPEALEGLPDGPTINPEYVAECAFCGKIVTRLNATFQDFSR